MLIIYIKELNLTKFYFYLFIKTIYYKNSCNQFISTAQIHPINHKYSSFVFNKNAKITENVVFLVSINPIKSITFSQFKDSSNKSTIPFKKTIKIHKNKKSTNS